MLASFSFLYWLGVYFIDSSTTINDSLEVLNFNHFFPQNSNGSYVIGNWFSLIIARNPVFNRSTPLIVYVNLSITKTWATLCWFSSTRGLGPNPWFPSCFLLWITKFDIAFLLPLPARPTRGSTRRYLALQDWGGKNGNVQNDVILAMVHE